ncbi:hypothetical protein SEA_OTTAWA_105 [Arthrobacter phage Ottawa]|nr:hypothetical protein SEA_KHARCHO_2 [Arthrobacter phage Kharcho]WIC89151.1 hypothetical protein SEA_KHARCHO_105 [Arthrobacter phage Kharcho]WIC89234.1 hypothetical protein SEA_OTTAWA_2 [Arthrobacter phage Ottawa]WIC89337.1 hypothetical protein SEA_OTTAWA_105 [Arthrobacter phage Ottawa]
MAEGTSYSVELVGSGKLVHMLIQAGAEATPALARALYEEGQLAFRTSQKRVPYRFGILKGSGRVFPPEVQAGDVNVTLGYGGNARKYAAAVHEINKNYRNGKSYKYLLTAVEERVAGFDSRIAKRIERIIGESSA